MAISVENSILALVIYCIVIVGFSGFSLWLAWKQSQVLDVVKRIEKILIEIRDKK